MAIRKHLLIIDDDTALCTILQEILASEGYQVTYATTAEQAISSIYRHHFDTVLLDLRLPDSDGLEVLQRIQKIDQHVPVIIISGHGTIEDAVSATRMGAYEWLVKPLEEERLLITVRNAVERSELFQDRTYLLAEARERYRMVGVSKAMQNIFSLIDKIARVTCNVLIQGETGTGKNLIARAIHLNSPRASKPFVEFNCAAMPDTLVESELFGYKKGAFTGALQDKAGRFQMANGGTLFLDEIGDLSLLAQAKILSAIETGQFIRVGANHAESTDLKCISSTNKNIEEMVAKNAFREDLFHRINVIKIYVPPLRDRKEDILPLADHFFNTFKAAFNKEDLQITPNAKAALLAMEWKGNIRELRNFIERLIVLTNSEIIDESSITKMHSSEMTRTVQKTLTLSEARNHFDKQYIEFILDQCRGNISAAARHLSISRSNLYQLMIKFKIDTVSNEQDNSRPLLS